MLKLFIDVDSVLFDSIGAVCNCYMKERSCNGALPHHMWQQVDSKKVKKWDMTDVLIDWTSEDIERCFTSDDFFNLVNPMQDSQRYISILSRLFDIYICSIGRAENVSKKVLKVKEFFPEVKQQIMLVKEEVGMGKEIVDMSGAIFVDDHQKNLLTSNADIRICFSDRGFDCEWNNDWMGWKANSWKELYDKLIDVHKTFTTN